MGRNRSNTLWLVLGYHPLLANAVPRAVQAFQRSPSVALIAGIFPGIEVRVAWRNVLPTLGTFTRRAYSMSNPARVGRR